MSSNNTFVLEFKSTGSKLVIKQIDQSTGAIEKNTKAKQKNSAQNRKRSVGADKVLKQQKGIEQGTLNSTKAFSKMSQQLGGIVPIYAQVAANVFAITAAFGALERAADFGILTDAAAELEVQTGRSLTGIATSMKAITGEAISMKEALTQASIAASAGFDNTTIERLTQVSRNASVALGREMTDALNRVFKGAIKAEPELLDELGIILRLETAANKYAQALNKSAKDLTTFEKQQAVVNEVLEQGEEKFGRLSKVDPNPYTLLSSAFADITTNMLNFISTPIGEFIGFLSKNTESLTAIIILLSSSILKMSAGPIKELFVGFSKSIDNTLKSVTSLADQLGTAFTSRGIGIVENIDKVKISMSNLTKSVVNLGDVTKNGPGVKALRTAFSDSSTLTDIQKVDKGLLSVGKSLKLLKVDTAGNAASINTLKILEKDLKKTKITIEQAGKATGAAAIKFTAFGNALNNISLAANTAALSIKTVGLAASTAATDMLVAEGASQSWGSFRENIANTAKTTKGVTRVFSVAASGIGSVGAAIFKVIPFLSQMIIGWQVLSGVFTFFKDAFGLGDVSRLTEALEEQDEALESTSKSVDNYSTNLKGLPNTLDNINEKITLQANALQELNGSLKKVNSSIAGNGGFGFLSEIADIFNAGDLDSFKENLEKITKEVDKLGFGSQVTKDVKELATGFFSMGNESEIAGKKLEKTITNLVRIANNAKEANQIIIDGIQELNKTTSSLFSGLPQLSAVDNTLASISDLSTRLSTLDFDGVTDAISQFSSISIDILGLTETNEQIKTLEINTKTSELAIKALNNVIKDIKNGIGPKGLSVLDVEKLIEQSKAGLSNLKADILDSLVEPLDKAKKEFEAISEAAKVFEKTMQGLNLEKLRPTSSPIDSLSILLKEREALQKVVSTQDTIANKTKIKISESQKKIEEKINNLSIERRTLLVDEIKNSQRLAEISGDIATAVTNRTENSKKDARLELSLTKNKSRLLKKELGLNKTIRKGITDTLKVIAQGGSGFSNIYIDLNKSLLESNIILAANSNKTEEWAIALTKAQIEANRLEGFFISRGINSREASISETSGINLSTRAYADQLILSNSLNDSLFLRADAQALIKTNAIDAQTQALRDQKNNINKNLQSGNIGQIEAKTSIAIIDANIIEKEKKIVSLQFQSVAALSIQSEKTSQQLKSSNKFLKQEIKFGSLLTKQDGARLQIAKLREKLKGNGSRDIERIIKLTKEQIKLQRKLDFSKEIRKGAQAMNELADGMNRVNDAIDGGDSIEQFSSGLLLLQDIGDSIGGSFGDATKGLSSFSLAIKDTTETLSSISKERELYVKKWEEGSITVAEATREENLESKQTQAILSGTVNALGALSSSFKDGSDAAKGFAVAQHAVAIANAAVAITNAGKAPPGPAGLASAAAMISLLAGVLGAAGIAFSPGSGGDGGAAAGRKEYEASIGEQGLVGRDLRTNTLVDGLDSILSIDNLLYGETQKMVDHLASLNDNFSLLAASIFTAFGQGLKGLEFSGISSDDPRISSVNSTNIVGDLIGQVSDGINALSLGITDALGIGKISKEIGRFFGGKTSITEELLDKGLEFEAAITDVGNGLVGTLDTQIFNVIQTNTKRKRSFGRSTKFSSVIDRFTNDLEPTLADAFDEAFNSVLKGIDLAANEFTKAIPELDTDVLFKNLEGFKIDEVLSLEGLDEEEAQDAIAAFFSAATDDIVEELFPFIEKFRKAGEDLSGTFFRITADIATLDNAFSFAGQSIESLLNPTQLFNDATGTNISADIDSIINTKGLTKELQDQLNDLQLLDQSKIEPALSNAATQFSAEFTAAWVEEVTRAFDGDAAAFAQGFDLFIGSIFNEQELIDFKDNRAFEAINQGFTDLLAITEKLGRKDLSAVLLSGTLSAETARAFNDLALATGGFSEISAEGDLLGASMQGLLAKLGSSFDQLKRDATAIEDVTDITEDFVRNLDFVREIALFGLPDKEQQLLQTAFDYDIAIQAAREAGDDLGAVEIAFGLRRINIVKEAFEEIEEIIKGSMSSLLDSTIQVASASKDWDALSFSIVKINKLVDRLRKGINGTNLSSLIDTTDGIGEFSDNFKDILDAIDTASPTDIKNEIELVNELRDEIVNKYELEKDLIQEVEEEYKDFALDIKGFLDNLFLSDLSPLTNFEQLNEAEKQFEANLSAIRFGTEEEKATAIDNILESSTNFLEQASEFFAIGPAYQEIFDRVTSSLDSLGLDFDNIVTDTSVEDKLEELNVKTLEQLSVLDDVLLALEANNLDTLAQDVGNAVSEGLLGEIKGITHKLGQLGDDGIWNFINQVLKDTKTAAAGQHTEVITNLARYDINKLTGDIKTAIGEGFAGVNVKVPTPQVTVNITNTPQDPVIIRLDPPAFVPGVPTNPNPTTPGTAPTGAIHNPRPEPLPPVSDGNVLSQSTISGLSGILGVLDDLSGINSSNESFTESQTLLQEASFQLDNIRQNLLSFSFDNLDSLTGAIESSFNELFFTIKDNVSTPSLSNITEIEQLLNTIFEQGTTIPGFDVGTPKIPKDMLANVHKGEMVIPETFAQGIRKGTISLGGDVPESAINEFRQIRDTSNNDDVVRAVRELTQVLALSQEDLLDAGNRNSDISEQIAKALQSNNRITSTSGVV